MRTTILVDGLGHLPKLSPGDVTRDSFSGRHLLERNYPTYFVPANRRSSFRIEPRGFQANEASDIIRAIPVQSRALEGGK
jgi:hypothetical protein